MRGVKNKYCTYPGSVADGWLGKACSRAHFEVRRLWDGRNSGGYGQNGGNNKEFHCFLGVMNVRREWHLVNEILLGGPVVFLYPKVGKEGNLYM